MLSLSYTYPFPTGSGGARPESIPDLGLWLKGDAGITLVGGNVDVWADQSGNGRDFSAPGASNRPAYSSTLNGLPVLTFDGSTDYLSGNLAARQLTQNVTGLSFFSVHRHTAGTSYRFYANSIVGGAAARATYGGNGTAYTQITRRLDADGATTITGGTQSTDYVLLSFMTRYSVATGAIFLNGVSQVDTAMGTAGNTQDTTSQVSFVGCGTVLSDFLSGDIAEIIVYRRAITPTERQSVESYLMQKWGVM